MDTIARGHRVDLDEDHTGPGAQLNREVLQDANNRRASRQRQPERLSSSEAAALELLSAPSPVSVWRPPARSVRE